MSTLALAFFGTMGSEMLATNNDFYTKDYKEDDDHDDYDDAIDAICHAYEHSRHTRGAVRGWGHPRRMAKAQRARRKITIGVGEAVSKHEQSYLREKHISLRRHRRHRDNVLEEHGDA